MIQIFNEDCNKTLNRFIYEGQKIDVVLTSPPYNNSRTCHSDYCMRTANCRYDSYNDDMTNEEYCNWTVNLFNKFDKVLSTNGAVLYNISYGSENPDCMWEVIADIIHKTNFMVADNIIWKKASALPNNVSSNKLTRITEYVFVLCRKSEFDTFHMNKKVSSISRTGQKFYESVFNYIEAPNNDGPCELNKATYSSELCTNLLRLYAPKNCFVYDPFMGTGTTAVACKHINLNCYGSELSEAQVKYAYDRLSDKVSITNNDTKIELQTSNLW